ncbi:MAG: NFACT family protein [Bacteroidota bacterium]
MDFVTLQALSREWDARWRGAALTDAWTQAASELTLGLVTERGESDALRVLCDPSLPLLWRSPGGGRKKSNTTDVLPDLVGQTVEGVRTPERDRFLVLDLSGGLVLWIRLFGPRPNAVLVREGAVMDSFLGSEESAPETRPAPHPDTAEAFRARWRPNRKTSTQALRAAVPLLAPALAADALHRARLGPEADPAEVDPDVLWPFVREAIRELETPRAFVVWRGTQPEAFLPATLRHPPADWRMEAFETFDEAASTFAKRSLASRHYRRLYAPVEKALTRAYAKRKRSSDAMLNELSEPSRADRYEAWGHLLMAQATTEGPGREEIVLPDILSEPSETVTIPLDPALSAVENAQRYYDRARRTRRSREEAEGRWEEAHADAEAMGNLLARLRATDTLHALRDFLDEESDALARFTRPEARGGDAEPFHRFDLGNGWEALVGKHARGNAHLTTRVASAHDLWLHARGVPGSHVVVKKSGRDTVVPAPVVERAARLAARFSRAKTQSLVPVQVTERKYVRPVKGGPPGLVRVDREDVMLVEPAAE